MPAASTDRTTSRLRCWAVRTARKTAPGLAIALVLVVFIRGTAAQTFTTPAGFMLPEIRAGSHALVWKWRSDLQPDQIIVYRDAQGRAMFGRVVGAADRMVTITRGDEADMDVTRSDVIGRVTLNTR